MSLAFSLPRALRVNHGGRGGGVVLQVLQVEAFVHVRGVELCERDVLVAYRADSSGLLFLVLLVLLVVVALFALSPLFLQAQLHRPLEIRVLLFLRVRLLRILHHGCRCHWSR